MTKWCLMLKRGLSTILHHTSFFTEKFECSPGSIKEVNVSFFFLQGGFDISDIVFGCDYTTYNPSPRVCSLNFWALQPCSPYFRKSIARRLDQACFDYEE